MKANLECNLKEYYYKIPDDNRMKLLLATAYIQMMFICLCLSVRVQSHFLTVVTCFATAPHRAPQNVTPVHKQEQYD